jgi:hypothetical protein
VGENKEIPAFVSPSFVISALIAGESNQQDKCATNDKNPQLRSQLGILN